MATTTVSTQDKRELQPSVVEAALSPSFTRKSQISEAQQRCLDLQTENGAPGYKGKQYNNRTQKENGSTRRGI